ncbi:sugar phosphate isomerase/epimerase family protein [Brenneria corticis]|nr:sugar phosphate isomerase/epimerase family protein [Brenneria sp. CFCC 11842]
MIKFSATLTYQYDAAFSSFLTRDFYAGLDWLKNNEFDAVEICISNYQDTDIRALSDNLRQRNLACSTIATGQAHKKEGLSLISTDKNMVCRTQERLFQHIDTAAILHSHVTIGSLRCGENGLSEQEYCHRLTDSLQPCINLAQQAGVTLIIEALNRYEAPYLNSASSMADFLNSMDNPSQVGILWDTFHANIEDPNVSEAIQHMGDKLKHVHFADSNRHFPGYGHIDFGAIYQALKQSDYQGYISLECLNLPSAQTVINKAGAFIQQLRSCKAISVLPL